MFCVFWGVKRFNTLIVFIILFNSKIYLELYQWFMVGCGALWLSGMGYAVFMAKTIKQEDKL